MTGTRSNFGVGIPLLLFFFVGGIAFWFAMPGIFIGQIWVGVSVLLAVIFGALYAKQRGEQRVATEGIQGTAQILGMTQTGTYINEQPQVRLHMRVQAPGITPYELEKSFIVPLIALGSLSAGTLNVAIDREDHENVVINWAQTAAPMTLSTPDGRTFDIGANPQLRQQVFAILGKHGLGTSGTLDLRQHPQARAEVIALLESQGHDADGDGRAGTMPAPPPAGAATPSPTVAPTAAPAAGQAKATPAERLEDLRLLKEKGLISEAEYESKRIQIISEF